MKKLALLLAFFGPALGAEQLFNVYPYITKTYEVWVADDDGHHLFSIPAPAGYTHHAWPSGLITATGETRAYTSLYGAGWHSIGMWEGADVDHLVYQGVVFVAGPVEPHGIGPAWVGVLGDGSYAMYYLVRGPAGPGPTIALATSQNGTSWTRQGVVVSGYIDPLGSGLTMSHACELESGEVALFYSEYLGNFADAFGAVAVGTAWGGPFGASVRTIAPEPFAFVFNARSNDSRALGTFPLGVPLFAAGSCFEPVIATAHSRGWTFFDRPFQCSFVNHAIYGMSKAEISWAEQLADGSWRGVATVYGNPSGWTSEYTTPVSSPELSGPWEFTREGFAIPPWTREGWLSSENPHPIQDHSRCRP